MKSFKFLFFCGFDNLGQKVKFYNWLNIRYKDVLSMTNKHTFPISTQKPASTESLIINAHQAVENVYMNIMRNFL